MKKKLTINYFITLLLLLFCTFSFSQKVRVGDRMPQFELLDQFGEYFDTLDYINKQPMVVFFYTEDEAEICTREVIAFNKSIQEFKDLNAIVVGINPASVIFHRRFVIKLQLEYPILFDRNSEVQKMFRVPNYKKTKKPERFTFIIDKQGIIQKVFHNNDNAEIHIIESLKTLNNL